MKDQAEVRCREEERRGARGIFSDRRANSAQVLYTNLLLLVLVYRMDDPKVVLLLFGSGKMVCVGAREVNNIKDAVRNIKEELSTAGLMRT